MELQLAGTVACVASEDGEVTVSESGEGAETGLNAEMGVCRT